MKHLYIRLKTFFNTIRSKIAFYPSLLAFVGFNLAFLMVWFETMGVSKKLLDYLPQLIIEDGDTVLTLLSACIGGLISMMVFSFSMVMLLLSQASSNFTPRLLPGLISDKNNQIILGTYLATIVYLIFTLFSIEPDDEKYALPGLSILLGIILTLICLGAFIYFIHNMSQSIQINNILDNIFYKSKERLEATINTEAKKNNQTLENFPDTSSWHVYKAPKSGYFQNISLRNLIAISEEHDTLLHFTVPKGFFVLKNVPFIKSEKKLDEETIDEIFSNLNFARGELIEDNYVLAFKQIVEITVKAMSPGINDPGTAINAIDYLTELFALRMKKLDSGVIIKDQKPYLKIEVVSFEELLYNCMASLRTYCKHDPILAQKLVWMLNYLEKQDDVASNAYLTAIANEKKSLLKDVKKATKNKNDFLKVKALASH